MKDRHAVHVIAKIFAGIMLAVAFALCIPAFMQTGVSAAEKPTKKEARALYKKISKANNIKSLLKNHKSVLRVNESDGLVWFTDAEAYLRSSKWKYAIYADGSDVYYLDWGKNYFSYDYPMDKGVDMYDSAYIRYYIDDVFTVKGLLEDKVVSIEYTDDSIILTRKLNKNSEKQFKESYGITDVTGRVKEELVIDRDTYEVKLVRTYTGKDRENLLIPPLKMYYDVEEPMECTILRGVGKRTDLNMITCTIVRDAGTEDEVRIEKTIPAGASVGVTSTGTDGKFYADPECTKIHEEWDYLSDTTFYIKTADAQTE